MAYMATISVRCKNKLCDYTGSVKHYGHEKANLVCPTCGFKTLEQYWPEFAGMFEALDKARQ